MANVELDVEDVEDKLLELTGALARAGRLVVLTGAGISTESGIPDYRSENGLLAKHTPIYYADFVRNPAVR
ncbi:MAG: Sir2 family NAD-dependent protein deacetylase, partial [Chloroflexota bacterium]